MRQRAVVGSRIGVSQCWYHVGILSVSRRCGVGAAPCPATLVMHRHDHGIGIDADRRLLPGMDAPVDHVALATTAAGALRALRRDLAAGDATAEIVIEPVDQRMGRG